MAVPPHNLLLGGWRFHIFVIAKFGRQCHVSGGKAAKLQKDTTVMDEQRLWSIYRSIPIGDCDGCHECGEKCAGEIKMTRLEFLRIRAYLGDRAAPAQRQRAVGEFAAPCRFYDPSLPGCIVYPVRPLICRLFGLVQWLPCPIGRRQPEVENAGAIMEWYSTQDLRTYAQWLEQYRS